MLKRKDLRTRDGFATHLNQVQHFIYEISPWPIEAKFSEQRSVVGGLYSAKTISRGPQVVSAGQRIANLSSGHVSAARKTLRQC